MAQGHLNKSIDVWLLTGYLGAGKTTTLNHLLRSEMFCGRRLALVINEFGKMGVDGQLVEPGDYAKYEINKGSLFCICTKTEFLRAFQEIGRQGFDTVLIEATGIAETADLEQLLAEPTLADCFRIRANICIVDGVNFIKTAAFLKAAVSQVQWADGVVINKTDGLSEKEIGQVQAVVEELNSSAELTQTQFGKIQTGFLKGLLHQSHGRPLSTGAPPEIPTTYFTTNQPVNRDLFYKTLDSLKDHILRLKGDVGFGDGPRFVEVVGAQTFEKPFCGKFDMPTAFTVIGWKIERQQLNDAFCQCVAGERIETE
jgi:G3E family GTPase